LQEVFDWSDTMGKWLAGVLATIIAGVAVYWLTKGVDRDPLLPPTPTVASAPIGYLWVPDTAAIRSISDLGSGMAICGTDATIAQLRSAAELSRFTFRTIAGPELVSAHQQGLCAGVLFREREHATQLFPPMQTGGRVLEIRN
jgi:hypothetical protein